MELAVARLTNGIGGLVGEERRRRGWTMRELGRRAGLSVAAIHAVESGRAASMLTYSRIAHALGLRAELVLTDPRRQRALTSALALADPVHAAMGELEAGQLVASGCQVGIDEPYQHYQFAGRADLIAWRPEARALLHIENRTRLPNVQEMAGAWNAKRTYLPGVLGDRLGIRRWESVAHVMAVLWSAEVLSVLRRHSQTFRALCPDPPTAFATWWAGESPLAGFSSTLVVLDPCAVGRARVYCALDERFARPATTSRLRRSRPPAAGQGQVGTAAARFPWAADRQISISREQETDECGLRRRVPARLPSRSRSAERGANAGSRRIGLSSPDGTVSPPICAVRVHDAWKAVGRAGR